MQIGLTMKGFTFNEMLAWPDRVRKWWYDRTIKYQEDVEEDIKSQTSK